MCCHVLSCVILPFCHYHVGTIRVCFEAVAHTGMYNMAPMKRRLAALLFAYVKRNMARVFQAVGVGAEVVVDTVDAGPGQENDVRSFSPVRGF